MKSIDSVVVDLQLDFDIFNRNDDLVRYLKSPSFADKLRAVFSLEEDYDVEIVDDPLPDIRSISQIKLARIITEDKTIPLFLKQIRTPDRSEAVNRTFYERRIYQIINDRVLPGYLEPGPRLIDHHWGGNFLVFEFVGKPDFSDFKKNNLEGKVKTLEQSLEESKCVNGSVDVHSEAYQKIYALATKVLDFLAVFHYTATAKLEILLDRAKSKKDDYYCVDVRKNNELFRIWRMTPKDYAEQFIEDHRIILNYFSNFINTSKTRVVLNAEERDNPLVDFSNLVKTDNSPFGHLFRALSDPACLVHADLHGRNIIEKDEDAQLEAVDLKHVKVASYVVDAFIYDEFKRVLTPEDKALLYETVYMRKLKELISGKVEDGQRESRFKFQGFHLLSYTDFSINIEIASLLKSSAHLRQDCLSSMDKCIKIPSLRRDRTLFLTENPLFFDYINKIENILFSLETIASLTKYPDFSTDFYTKGFPKQEFESIYAVLKPKYALILETLNCFHGGPVGKK